MTKKSLHLLIIDDDPSSINEILVTQGYETIIAKTAADVEVWLHQVDQKKSSPADLILLDLAIPQIYNMPMYQWLQSQKNTAGIPVIILSEIGSIEKRVECLSLGACDYLVKPFSVDDLLMRVAVQLQLNQRNMAKSAVEPSLKDVFAAINDISHQAAQHLNLKRILTSVIDCVMELLHIRSCHIYLYDPDTEELNLKASSNQLFDKNLIPEIVYMSSQQSKITTWHDQMALPILRDDVCLGALYIMSHRSSPISIDIIKALKILAVQLSTAITNAYLFQDIRVRNMELDTVVRDHAQLLNKAEQQRHRAEQLHQMSQLISSSLDMEDVLGAAIESLKSMIHVERGSIFLLDEQNNTLSFSGTLRRDEEGLADQTIPADQGIVGQVVQAGTPLIVNDALHHPNFFNGVDSITGNQTNSILCIPLKARAKVIGAIELINKENGDFDEIDMSLVESVATSIAIALDNANLYKIQKTYTYEIARSQEQLLQSEKMAATGRLAASLAHEINNPLQAIHSCLQLAVHFNLPPEKQNEYLNMANEEVERLIDLVTRILEFSRPSPAQLEKTNLNDIVERVLLLTHKHQSHGKWRLQKELTTELPLVPVIPDQIAQAFLCIALNAFDAMPQGGALNISTHINSLNEVEVVFSDNGHGMPPDIQEQIFEPFFTTTKDGTGLGLTITYGIIERHGGRILVDSDPETGTVFRICLPTPFS